MFSRKPKEKKVPEVNVLPTPVLVPPVPEEGPSAGEEALHEEDPPTAVLLPTAPRFASGARLMSLLTVHEFSFNGCHVGVVCVSWTAL